MIASTRIKDEFWMEKNTKVSQSGDSREETRSWFELGEETLHLLAKHQLHHRGEGAAQHLEGGGGQDVRDHLTHLCELGGIGGVPGESTGEGVAEEEEPLLALLDLPLLLLPPQAGPAQESRQGRSRGHHALPTVEEEKAEVGT